MSIEQFIEINKEKFNLVLEELDRMEMRHEPVRQLKINGVRTSVKCSQIIKYLPDFDDSINLIQIQLIICKHCNNITLCQVIDTLPEIYKCVCYI